MLRLSQIWPVRSPSGWLLCPFKLFEGFLPFRYSKMFQVPLAQSLTEPWNQPLLWPALVVFSREWYLETKNGLQVLTLVFKSHPRCCVHLGSMVFIPIFPVLMIDPHLVSTSTAVRSDLWSRSSVDLCVYIYVDLGLLGTTPECQPLLHISTPGAWASLHLHKYLALTSFLIFAKWINVLGELLF